jgi:hypothetical protein
MARKRVVLTPAQIEERKRLYWGPERNAERRRRYREDPAYRAAVQQQVKESYRRARLEAGLPVRDADCRQNIDDLDNIGTERPLRLTNGETVDALTFTTEEMAKALGRNQQVLYRWYAADMFPRPAVLAETPTNRNQPVYTHDEAVALMQVFGQHQEESQYYRRHHDATARQLRRVANNVRAALRSEGVQTKEDA